MKKVTNGYASLKSNLYSFSKLFLVCIITLFCFTFNVKAGPGDSCNTAIAYTIGDTSMTVHTMSDTAYWIKFPVHNDSTIHFFIESNDTAINLNISTIKQYSGSCGSLTLI